MYKRIHKQDFESDQIISTDFFVIDVKQQTSDSISTEMTRPLPSSALAINKMFNCFVPHARGISLAPSIPNCRALPCPNHAASLVLDFSRSGTGASSLISY